MGLKFKEKFIKPVIPIGVRDFWQHNIKLLIFLLFLTILSTAVSLTFPLILRYIIDVIKDIIDGINIKEKVPMVFRYVFVLLGFGLARSLLSIFLPFLRGKTNELFSFRIRNRIYNSFFEKGHSFVNKFPSGDIIERLSEDLFDYAWFACSGIFRPVEGIFTILISLIILLKMNPLLTILALIPIFLAFSVWLKLGPSFSLAYQLWREKISLVFSFLQSSFFGIRLVKANLMEDRLNKKLSELLNSRIESAVKVARLEAKMGMLYAGIGESSIVIVLLIGGLLVMQNKITLGQFVAFNAYIMMLLTPMFDISNFFIAGRRAVACETRLRELEKHPSDVDGGTIPITEDAFSDIRFERVSFSYAPNLEPVLKDLDLSIKKGLKIGIVGPVGSGKTTFIRLLLKLAEPTSGVIKVNGGSLTEIEKDSYRRLFAYAPQDSFIFSDTIYNNLLLDEEIKEEELKKVVDLVCFQVELKEFKNGINEIIGEKGVGLSGGQKQKVALLRALVKEKPFIILDDATSNLDSKTELAIINNILKEKEGKTLIIVSHRLSTLINCDLIYVFDEGKVVEMGTHEELLQKRGLYYQLYEKQLLKEELAIEV